MPYMRNAATGTIIGPLQSDAAEYRYLQQQKSGNQPVWEDVGVEDAEAAGLVIDGKVAQTIQAVSPAVALGADNTITVGRAPFAGTIAKAEYFPAATMTGAATNNRNLNVLNGGQAGSSSTLAAQLSLTSGNNAPANQSANLPLSGTPANLNVAAGDVIEFQSQHVGTGIADPGGLVVVTFTRE